MMTASNAYIFPCGLSNGTIGLMIWRSRCNKPVNHLLIYDCKDKVCYILKRSWFHLKSDLSLKFDRDEVLQYVFFLKFVLMTDIIFILRQGND